MSGTAIASGASVMRGVSPRSAAPGLRSSGGVTSAMKIRCQRDVGPGTMSLTYRIMLGNCSSNTRGWTSAVSFVRDQLILDAIKLADRPRRQPQWTQRRPPHRQEPEAENRRNHAPSRNARGAHRGDLAVGRHAAEREQRPDQHAQRNRERKHLRQHQREQIRDRAGDPDVRTRNSNSVRARCRNMTNVNSTAPSTRLTKISRKMMRLSRRMRNRTVYDTTSTCGGGTTRRFRQLLLRQLEFDFVEQQRRRDHGGRSHIAARAQHRQRSAVVDVIEQRRFLRRGQNVAQGPRRNAAESQAAHQFLAAVGINAIHQHRRAHRPRTDPRLRPTSAPADPAMPPANGKSSLRTSIPYGLPRSLHMSISFFFRSASGVASVTLDEQVADRRRRAPRRIPTAARGRSTPAILSPAGAS